MSNKAIVLILIYSIITVGCKQEVLPKPKAMLRLEYPKNKTETFETENFKFNYNSLSKIKEGNSTSITLSYPQMNGTIFLSYKPVTANLNQLLSDAQKLSYEHAAKADDILEQPFINEEGNVFGMLYDVKGDAASQAQFYVTDSTKHFLTGSLYFNTKPNYDSIYPAAIYLQDDIRKLMESLRWKNNN
tara:strand:+ start:146 stop:709 length:564 start_codon:yes stop_codon:yes gene_type:complete